MTRKQYFSSGLKDGMPICFGYFAVSFAFGIQAAGIGLSVFEASVLSALNVTSAGQFAALAIIASGASLIELAFTQLIINLRYFLMSCALSQKLSPSLPLGHRLGIAYGMTDEIFAVSVSQREPLSPFYSYGLIAVAIPGWVLGTALGAAAGNILPTVLTNALGIAIYGMFIAIILPPAKENRVVAGVVVLSMVLSALFTYLPVLCNISSGFRIIVITLITAGGAALLFPIPDEPAEPEKEMPHEGLGFPLHTRYGGRYVSYPHAAADAHPPQDHKPHTALVSLLCAVRHAFRHDLPGNSHCHRQRHQRRARLCRRFDFSIPR